LVYKIIQTTAGRVILMRCPGSSWIYQWCID
jgi:hypothetical protein